MTSELLGRKALGVHIMVGLVVCGLLLVLLWLQTQSVAVIINAFGGLVMALTVGRWLEQRDHQRETDRTDANTTEAENA